METEDILSFLKIHKLKIFFITALLGIALYLYVHAQHSKQEGNKKDFLKVKTLVERFYAHEPLPQEALAELQGIFTRHPELAFHYGSVLALSGVPQQEGSSWVQQIAQLQIHTLQTQALQTQSLPYYGDFLKISAIIHANTSEALRLSQELESALQIHPHCEKLRVMNLIRMVFLAEQLMQPSLAQVYYQTAAQLPSYAEYAALFETRGKDLETFFSKS